jgi:hypothetical protein
MAMAVGDAGKKEGAPRLPVKPRPAVRSPQGVKLRAGRGRGRFPDGALFRRALSLAAVSWRLDRADKRLMPLSKAGDDAYDDHGVRRTRLTPRFLAWETLRTPSQPPVSQP